MKKKNPQCISAFFFFFVKSMVMEQVHTVDVEMERKWSGIKRTKGKSMVHMEEYRRKGVNGHTCHNIITLSKLCYDMVRIL